jgi:hypothetical protein
MPIVKLTTQFAICLCLANASVSAQARRAQQTPISRSFVQDTISTKAGLLKLVRVEDNSIGETNWVVALNNKMLYRTQDDVFGSVNFHTIFKAGLSNEVILLRETFDQGGCAQFRLIIVNGIGAAIVTERFGTCDRDPIIMLQAGKLTLDFLPTEAAATKPERWIFQNARLTRVPDAQ